MNNWFENRTKTETLSFADGAAFLYSRHPFNGKLTIIMKKVFCYNYNLCNKFPTNKSFKQKDHEMAFPFTLM